MQGTRNTKNHTEIVVHSKIKKLQKMPGLLFLSTISCLLSSITISDMICPDHSRGSQRQGTGALPEILPAPLAQPSPVRRHNRRGDQDSAVRRNHVSNSV